MNLKEKRPWGNFKIIHQEPGITIKIISVKGNQRLSLQSHRQRDEVWLLLDGEIYFQRDIEKNILSKNVAILIPKHWKHRLSAGSFGGRVLEISFGKFNEKDIVRYEDDYGRTKLN